MKIIKDNYSKFNKELVEFKCTCPNCQSILETNENDVQYDREDMEHYIICPCCHMRITDEYFDRTVTLDNISYPFDFYKCINSDTTKKLSDDEINLEIRKCINYLKKNPNDSYMYVDYGDSFIGLFDCGQEYHFIVAKNCYETFVDKT